VSCFDQNKFFGISIVIQLMAILCESPYSWEWSFVTCLWFV